MKTSIPKTLLCLILSLSAWAHAAAFDAQVAPARSLHPTEQEIQAAHMAADILDLYHYREVPPDPDLSVQVFDQYLKSLDPEKLFLLQSDVDRFSDDRASIAQKVRQDDLRIPFAIYDLYALRVVERFQYARHLLEFEFDFKTNETLQVSRRLQPWAQTQDELDDVWRKRIKSEWLALKLAGKNHDSIASTLDKRYARAIKRMEQSLSADAFQIFMNAYAMAIEPHTNYMGPSAAAEFDISMSLSLVGIGVAVSDAEGFATIMEVTAGGPASRSKRLRAGDRIVGVAQGAHGKMTNVMGLPSEDLVSLIRGPVGTVVKLAVLPASDRVNGKRKVVTLVRRPIAMEGEAARSSIENTSDGVASRRIGVITLPSFYEDFAGKQADKAGYRSATRDVEKLLAKFNASHVDGVLIDLRNNGGGSLAQAIELTSLFVGNVPVVQQRNAAGEVMVGLNDQARVRWQGPLGVLINKYSASASEIFAAAIQDHGRGVVMGQSSYGKGTVQLMVDLDELVQNEAPQLGELKMTIAQFFRVNGGSTQLQGVTPDIGLSGYFDEGALGESAFDNALPWSRIEAVCDTPNATIGAIVPALVAKHVSRTLLDADLQRLQQAAHERQRQRDKNEISLNESERRQERAVMQAQLTAQSSGSPKDSPGPATVLAAQGMPLDDGMLPGERSFEEEQRAERSKKALKDTVLIESTRIMNDAIGLLQAGKSHT